MKWKVTDIATIEVYGKDRRRDKIILRNMREEFQELGDAYMFKEALRAIYSRAQTFYHTRIAFHCWIKLAKETRIPELRTMAKTLRDKIEGIISFWTFRVCVTNFL